MATHYELLLTIKTVCTDEADAAALAEHVAQVVRGIPRCDDIQVEECEVSADGQPMWEAEVDELEAWFREHYAVHINAEGHTDVLEGLIQQYYSSDADDVIDEGLHRQLSCVYEFNDMTVEDAKKAIEFHVDEE